MNTQYEEHLHEMFENKIDEFDDEKKMSMLQRVLSFLPNGGKLYKYRSIDDPSFTNTYNSLNDGYIWLSAASELNDDEDTVLYYNPEAECEQLKEYLFSHPYLLLRMAYKTKDPAFDFGDDAVSDFAYSQVLECYDRNTGELIESKAVKALSRHGYSIPTCIKFVKELKKFTEGFLKENESAVTNIVDAYLHFNETNRKNCFVFSMSESYDNELMWAHYANSNKGFCIEYDFNKAPQLKTEIWRKLISIYKVIYKDEQEEFSFMRILDYIMKGQTDKEEYKSISYDMMQKLLTKKAFWNYEKEWRILLYNIENKLYADLVSGIIIDDRIIGTDNGKKLLELCEQRGWNITVRTKNVIHTKHEYISYDEWETRRKQDAKS